MKSRISFFSSYRFEWMLFLHLGLGVLASTYSNLVFIWVAWVLLYKGMFRIFFSKNKTLYAAQVAAYLAGMEMILRMARIGLPHELTKYSIILVLFNGFIAHPGSAKGAWKFFVYFILLVLSAPLVLTIGDLDRARQLLSFNLSGPLCLAVSSFYFFRRVWDFEELASVLKQFLLPLTATIGWLLIDTPKLSEIEFGLTANFAASGYGPNQMASLLGAGLLLIGLAFLFRIPIFRSRPVAIGLLILIAYRGLLTFSRGGMLAPVFILGLLVAYFFLTSGIFRMKFGRLLGIGLLLAVISVGVFMYINSKTDNALFKRYAGIQRNGERVSIEKYSSGRVQIMEIDTRIFLDNPVWGIGPGMGTSARLEYGYGVAVAAHIEFTRMFAEHGFFGIIAFLLLLGIPIQEYFRRRSIETRFFLIACTLFTFSFMLHSATRIALPMFLYGLGFVYLVPDKSRKAVSVEANPDLGKHRLASV